MVLEVINLRKVKNNVYIFYIVLYTFNQLLNDSQLKLIIQWIAASITSRYLDYNIDENLFSLVTYLGADDFQSIIQEIQNRYPTVSELYNACIRICNSENKHNIIIQLLS